jgi:hypothetical protein
LQQQWNSPTTQQTGTFIKSCQPARRCLYVSYECRENDCLFVSVQEKMSSFPEYVFPVILHTHNSTLPRVKSRLDFPSPQRPRCLCGGTTDSASPHPCCSSSTNCLQRHFHTKHARTFDRGPRIEAGFARRVLHTTLSAMTSQQLNFLVVLSRFQGQAISVIHQFCISVHFP